MDALIIACHSWRKTTKTADIETTYELKLPVTEFELNLLFPAVKTGTRVSGFLKSKNTQHQDIKNPDIECPDFEVCSDIGAFRISKVQI